MSKQNGEDDVVETPKTPKIAVVIGMLRAADGADIASLVAATGWQPHTVRGAIAGHIKKKLGLTVLTAKHGGKTIYRIGAAT